MKEGDKVMCLKDFMCPLTGDFEFTQGKVYVVKAIDKDTVYVERDDLGHTDNGWKKKNFQVVQ